MSWFPVRLSLRRFFYFIIAVAILIAGLATWISQLDFNRYRAPIEEQLSQMLEQPVRVGNVSLAFSRGLALEVQELMIGQEELPIATIPTMMATLELKPLLERRIAFHDIRLLKPHVNLILPEGRQDQANTDPVPAYEFPEALSINRLDVSDAEVNIYKLKGQKLSKQAHFAKLQANITHLQPQTVADIVITGQLKNRNASFLLETTLPPQLNQQQWRHTNFQTKLTIKHLETKGLLSLKKQHFPKAVDLQIEIEGSPLRGARVTTTVKGSEDKETLASLAGMWGSDDQTDQLAKLSGDLLGVPLSGQIVLSHNGQENHLHGQLGVSNLALNPALLKRWRIPHSEELIGGKLKQLRLTLNERWLASEELSQFPDIDADIDLEQLQWRRPEIKFLQDFSADITLNGQQLAIKNGHLHLNNNLFSFQGKVDALFKEPNVSGFINTEVPASELFAKVQLPADLKVAGQIPIKLQLAGLLPFPEVVLRADLTPLEVSYSDYFEKKQGIPSDLRITGQADELRFNVNQAELTLNHQSIAASGYFQRSAPAENYKITLQDIELPQLSSFSRRLKKLEPEGFIGGTLERHQKAWQGQLRLNRFGAHLTSIIGKLRNTSGTIDLNRSGMVFAKLQAGLGESMFHVSGKLENWTSPTLLLDVNGTKIRAHDLIFRNEDLTLYDLDGHLLIDADGIQFSPVDVRLEEGTSARVTGAVRNFRDPEVNLDITGAKVDVLDVINLFIGPDKTPQQKSQPITKEHKPIIISVHADQGIIKGFRFENASGLITETHERFVLAPLTFENGNGHGDARVVYDRTDPAAPLKISGHVNQIDASVLHQDLFDKPGLITGALDGDFYIEGDPGESGFWPQAKGGMHIKVNNGVLRKFNTLSKVFSILNVAQLFKGQLPNMDREGMPFSLLEASVVLEEGRATTEDLLIHSDAMNISMVGWQGIVQDNMDFTLGIMPLGTVDKVITSIPLAGWVLTGENKAFLTAYFKLTGNSEDPNVSAIPIDSLSDTVLGVFRRTFGLPGKLIKDIRDLFKSTEPKKIDP